MKKDIEFFKRIGKLVRKERRAREWSQKKLGEMVGYSKETICAWEKAKKRIPADVLIKITDMFNIDIKENECIACSHTPKQK